MTERKQSEDSLHRVQAELAHVARVVALGTLTASIAHEVSQPLSGAVVNANASLLRWLAQAPPNLEEAREATQRIIRDGHRAGEVRARLRALFKKSSPARAPLGRLEEIGFR